MFYCIVAGSRSFGDYPKLCERLDYFLQHKQDVVIVSGGARGADSLAEEYAQSRGFRSVVIKANWNKYGKSAGFRRNRQMFEFIKNEPEHGCVCFWDGLSRGTADDIKLSAEYGVPCRVVRF